MAEADDVAWMVRGAWVSMCVPATCELGIMDALDEPQSLPELATRTSSDPATLARGEVLRVGHSSGNVGLLSPTSTYTFPKPQEVLDGLNLPPAKWDVLRSDEHQQEQTGPDGQTAIRINNVLELRRRTD